MTIAGRKSGQARTGWRGYFSGRSGQRRKVDRSVRNVLRRGGAAMAQALGEGLVRQGLTLPRSVIESRVPYLEGEVRWPKRPRRRSQDDPKREKCSVEGCKRPYRAKGYCRTTTRLWRRGELEGHKARYKICSKEACRSRAPVRPVRRARAASARPRRGSRAAKLRVRGGARVQLDKIVIKGGSAPAGRGARLGRQERRAAHPRLRRCSPAAARRFATSPS